MAVAMARCTPSDAGELERLGVTELVLVETPPEDPAQAAPWVADLARRWLPIDPAG